MSQARVDDINALRTFRASLQKFVEHCNVALNDAESDLTRTRLWLDVEQTPYWQGQVKKRTDLLAQAEEKLRMRKVFKDPTGARQSFVDEEKAVKVARQRLEEAKYKASAVLQWRRKLEKVSHDYRGSVQRFATTLAVDLPSAVARLEVLARQLEQYATLGPAEVASTAGAPQAEPAPWTDVSPSMARATPEPPPGTKAESTSDTDDAPTNAATDGGKPNGRL